MSSRIVGIAYAYECCALSRLQKVKMRFTEPPTRN